MVSTMETIPLARLPRELRALTGEDGPGYRTIYNKVLDGVIPAEQHNGRWFVPRSELGTVAKALGLVPPADAPKPRRRAA